MIIIKRLSYNFRVGNDFLAIRVKYSINVLVKLVELVNWLFRANIPKDAVVQNQMITWMKCGYVLNVTISIIFVVKCSNELPSAKTIKLMVEGKCKRNLSKILQ